MYKYTFRATYTKPITRYDAIRACNRSLINKTLVEANMTEDRTATTYGTSVETYASCGAYVLTELAVIPFYETPTKVIFAEGYNLPYGEYVTGIGFDMYQGWWNAE
ncbi:MAG: hypothetical protein IJE90_05015 [Clostridia bacterium]|nr:hypothetical protein [Clostridia bacterium]